MVQKFIKKLFALSWKNLFIGLVAIILVTILFSSIRKKPTTDNLITVTRGSIAEEVIVTGKIKPAESVDLAFERGGKIAHVYKKIGDAVITGQTLVDLDYSDLYAQLLQATASVESKKAKLDQLQKGVRPEEIRIQEVKVANAEAAVEDAKRVLVNTIQDGYTKSDDAIRNAVDKLYSNPRTANPQINISDFYQKAKLENDRLVIEKLLIDWQASIPKLDASSNISSDTKLAKDNLFKIKTFVDEISLGVNTLTPNANLSQTTIDAYKSAVSTARTNINTAISNLTSKDESLRTAEATLAVEENELILDKAGAVPEEIAAQNAEVKQAEANVENIKAQINKAILRSPISGIVTKQDAKIGQIAPANSTLTSVISTQNLEIEANIPEVDVGKLSIGNHVHITIDAFPGENFEGTISYIDPAETIVDGVVNFKVTIVFVHEDPRFKSGLTSNLIIEAKKKENALLVPQYAIIENDQGSFVRIQEKGNSVERPVQIGIRNKDGMVEIISGVQEGEKIENIGIKSP